MYGILFLVVEYTTSRNQDTKFSELFESTWAFIAQIHNGKFFHLTLKWNQKDLRSNLGCLYWHLPKFWWSTVTNMLRTIMKWLALSAIGKVIGVLIKLELMFWYFKIFANLDYFANVIKLEVLFQKVSTLTKNGVIGLTAKHTAILTMEKVIP